MNNGLSIISYADNYTLMVTGHHIDHSQHILPPPLPWYPKQREAPFRVIQELCTTAYWLPSPTILTQS